MIPGQADREDDQTLSDHDQSAADRDQTHADNDQTGSDRDQGASDLDQRAADMDQAASDRDLAHGLGREAYDSSREARVLTAEARRVTSSERQTTADARDATARERDLAAQTRDQAAEGRDQAARERVLAADARTLAAEDRALATAERETDEVDTVSGARRRAPGLAELQRSIDRAHQGNGRLIAAYVDVNHLKATNESKGRRAGDTMLRHIAEVLQTNLTSHEPVIRLSGDEFVCTISDTTMESARQRFDEITAELSLTPDEGLITVGLAELARGDTPMDLIARADGALIASRNANSRIRTTRT